VALIQRLSWQIWMVSTLRSTSQTSPRLGTRLLLVRQGKGLGGNGRQVIARQRAVITGNHGASDRLVPEKQRDQRLLTSAATLS
jgi:hypothetical protein